MVLSVAKLLPAGLHVCQTLDGKVNVKTQQLILHICDFVGLICDFLLSASLSRTSYFLNYVTCPIYKVSV